jgi:LuxR family transcriptional regulator, regulator of acetate metabolism
MTTMSSTPGAAQELLSGGVAHLTPQADSTSAEDHLGGTHRELLRSVFAELRGIRAGLREPESAERIRSLEGLLAEALHEGPAPRDARGEPQLAPRELDVLAHVALGLSNAGVAAALGIKESTVKSYLNTAMAKLDATTRHAAVSAARRLGTLP